MAKKINATPHNCSQGDLFPSERKKNKQKQSMKWTKANVLKNPYVHSHDDDIVDERSSSSLCTSTFFNKRLQQKQNYTTSNQNC